MRSKLPGYQMTRGTLSVVLMPDLGIRREEEIRWGRGCVRLDWGWVLSSYLLF